MDQFPELFHYSKSPVGEIVSRKQADSKKKWKPYGLWVSVDAPGPDGESAGWPAWCHAEQFGLENLAVKHRVKLVEPSRLLWITTGNGLEEFTAKYSKPNSKEPFIEIYLIDWDRVAADYPGVVIAPYQWSHRLDLMWYYGWDCASGCIWDASAIERIELVS